MNIILYIITVFLTVIVTKSVNACFLLSKLLSRTSEINHVSDHSLDTLIDCYFLMNVYRLSTKYVISAFDFSFILYI